MNYQSRIKSLETENERRKAENKELIEDHAKKGGFPANSISEVATMISPATAEQ